MSSKLSSDTAGGGKPSLGVICLVSASILQGPLLEEKSNLSRRGSSLNVKLQITLSHGLVAYCDGDLIPAVLISNNNNIKVETRNKNYDKCAV